MKPQRTGLRLLAILLVASLEGCGEKPDGGVEKPDTKQASPPPSAPVSPSQQSAAETDPLAESFTGQDTFEIWAGSKQDAAKKVIELRLVNDKQVLVNGRGNIMLDEFKQRLGKAMAQYEQQGVQPGEILVHLWAEESVSCGRFDKLIADCWENQIEHYVLKIEMTYLYPSSEVERLRDRGDKRLDEAPPINVGFSFTPRQELPSDDELPPIKITLQAKEDGSLAGIIWDYGMRLPSPSIDHLRDRAMDLRRKVSGAGGRAAPLTAEFDTDEELLFKHLAGAVLAVSVYFESGNQLAPLIENVFPTRNPAREELIEAEDLRPSPRSETKPDATEVPPLEGMSVGDLRNPYIWPTKPEPAKASSVAPENRITIDVAGNPESVAPGEKTTITVTVRSEDGGLLRGAKVTVKAGGGKFLPSSDAPFDPKSRLHGPYSAAGTSNEKGQFTTWWVANPAVAGYELSISASKEGYTGARAKHRIPIEQ